MRQDWYPQQRAAFKESLAEHGGRFEGTEQCRAITLALEAIGYDDPPPRMVNKLVDLAYTLGRKCAPATDVSEINGLIYDYLCEEFGTGHYLHVDHAKDPFHTASGVVERETRAILARHFPRATDIQVREAASAVYRRLEQTPCQPIDHSRDAWKARKVK